jgi:hypothetical protein
MTLSFRTVTVVEGPEIDDWMTRLEAIDDRELARWRAAYRLLGEPEPGSKTDTNGGPIPMEVLM